MEAQWGPAAASSATEPTLNPSVGSTANVENANSRAFSETALVLPDPFDATEDPEPRASAATSTGEGSGGEAAASHGASWLVEDPFTAVDSGAGEVFPSAAAPTAPPAGQEKTRAPRCDQTPEAAASEPLSRPASETATPAPLTGQRTHLTDLN